MDPTVQFALVAVVALGASDIRALRALVKPRRPRRPRGKHGKGEPRLHQGHSLVAKHVPRVLRPEEQPVPRAPQRLSLRGAVLLSLLHLLRSPPLPPLFRLLLFYAKKGRSIRFPPIFSQILPLPQNELNP